MYLYPLVKHSFHFLEFLITAIHQPFNLSYECSLILLTLVSWSRSLSAESQQDLHIGILHQLPGILDRVDDLHEMELEIYSFGSDPRDRGPGLIR